MSDEQDKLKLSLEAPKLFGRKKRAADKAGTPEEESAAPATEAPAKEAPAKKTPAKTTAKKAPTKKTAAKKAPATTADESAVTSSAAPTSKTDEPTAKKASVKKPAATRPAVPEPEATATKVMPAVPADAEPEPGPEPAPEPESDAEPEPGPEAAEEQPAPEPEVAPEPAAAAEPEVAAEPESEDAPDAAPAKGRWAARLGRKSATPPADASTDTSTDGDAALDDTDDTDAETKQIVDDEREDAEIAAMVKDGTAEPDAPQGPLLSTYWAAAVTGLVVGSAMVFFTWLALRGCESVRGTSSCGGGPGFVLLIITFALCVIIGRALLRAFTLPDPGSSSFLAVGFVAVIALLFLIDIIDHWSMIIIVPLLSIGGYATSVWITKTFVEPADG